MTDFEKIANVNVVNFIQILENLNLVESFKMIYSDGGITFQNKKKLITEMKIKREVFDEQKNYIRYEQDNRCISCNKKQFQLQIDHIQPLFMGGNNERCNLQGLCHDCHGEKTSSERMALDESIELAYKVFFSDVTNCNTSNYLSKQFKAQSSNEIISFASRQNTNTLKINSYKIIKQNSEELFSSSEIDDAESLIQLNTKKRNRLVIDNKYKCKICNKIYQDESGLRRHKSKKTSCISKENLEKKEIEFKNRLEQIENDNQKIIDEKNQEIIKLEKLIDFIVENRTTE